MKKCLLNNWRDVSLSYKLFLSRFYDCLDVSWNLEKASMMSHLLPFEDTLTVLSGWHDLSTAVAWNNLRALQVLILLINYVGGGDDTSFIHWATKESPLCDFVFKLCISSIFINITMQHESVLGYLRRLLLLGVRLRERVVRAEDKFALQTRLAQVLLICKFIEFISTNW